MDSKSFVKTLRTIIREEVQQAVRTELRALLTERTNSTYVAPVTETVSHTNKDTKPKKFVKDPLLNELLNDTASRPINLSEGSTLSFSSEMARAFGTSRQTESFIPVHDLDGKPVDTSKESVATVVNAMNKDYSSLMKAIDRKRGIK